MARNRFRIALFVATLAALPAGAVETAPVAAPSPAKVMVIGVFHFANPQRDMVKSGVIDVMTRDNQAYLAGLATRIVAFKPTDVLVECDPSEQGRYDAEFAAFRKGTFTLTTSEDHQIGFRVAQGAGIARVTCFDEGTVGWDAEPMFAYIKQNDPQAQAMLDAMYKDLSARADREQGTLSLQQLLQLSNDPARDRENKALYLRTNAIDAGAGFSGADAAASWWHRNFRMYANVQKAAAPGHRVVVVAGSGHTAILKDLLAADSQREAESVDGYLVP